MNNEEKVNQIARKLGLILVNSGMNMLQSAFHLEPIKISSTEINQIILKYLPSVGISHLDGWYYLIPLYQWKQLIEFDWVDTKKWILDARDCDNFSNAFSANASMYYEINSVGRVYGKYYKGTQEFVDYHYWNVIITAEKEIWFFEPQNDKLTEAKYQGGLLLIGGNRYDPLNFYFG